MNTFQLAEKCKLIKINMVMRWNEPEIGLYSVHYDIMPNVGFLRVLKTRLTLYMDNGMVWKNPLFCVFASAEIWRCLFIYLFMSLFGQNTEIKKKWLQHINRMPCNRLLRILKYYRPKGRKNQESPLERLWNAWDQGQKVAQIHVSLMIILICLY